MAEAFKGPACKNYEDVMERVVKVCRPGIQYDEVHEIYDTWAETYDQDMATCNYHLPRATAEIIAEEYKDNKDVRIISIAAGTGEDAVQLAKLGYTNIDAVDGSAGMLAVAKRKGVFKTLIHAFLSAEPSEIAENTYDVGMTVGTVAEGHLPPDVLIETQRIIKPGGKFFLVTALEYITGAPVFYANLEPMMQKLEDEGKWKKLYRKVLDEKGIVDTHSGVVYCFQIC